MRAPICFSLLLSRPPLVFLFAFNRKIMDIIWTFSSLFLAICLCRVYVWCYAVSVQATSAHCILSRPLYRVCIRMHARFFKIIKLRSNLFVFFVAMSSSKEKSIFSDSIWIECAQVLFESSAVSLAMQITVRSIETSEFISIERDRAKKINSTHFRKVTFTHDKHARIMKWKLADCSHRPQK